MLTQERLMRKQVAFLTMLVLILATLAFAQQDNSKRPSPPAQAQCKFADGKTITVDYSSPRTHDPKTHQPRKIYGGLVPYGEVWRTGANDARGRRKSCAAGESWDRSEEHTSEL